MHALSIPTWVIHVSSVIEWIAAIWLIWRYAEVSGNLAWRSLSLGMLPALVSAMCACTWHFFRQSARIGLGGDGASRDDGGGKLHASDRGLVDLAIV